MNKEWSELNKLMQTQIKKKDTYDSGIGTLFSLRDNLWDMIISFKDELSREEFNAIPYINAEGYHSKTIAYSLWHIFRIEDIVAHTLIKGDEQVFFREGYQKRINSPIITTGNELVKQEIADFSEQLLRRKVSIERKEQLESLSVVCNEESAIWLIDYWCNKDVRGLIQMPFSRHWIMHIEACLRIKKKIHS